MAVFTGETTTLLAHHRDYADARHHPTSAIRLWPRTERIADAFVSATLPDVLLTSLFVPIDLGASRMFLDQTYSGVNGLFPTRFTLEYHLLVSATSDDVSVGLTIAQSAARDYVVDPTHLQRTLARATGPGLR